MDRTELTIVAATALMVALGLGWVLRWIYSLLNPPPPPAPKADSEWAEYARACEAQRDEAQARLAEVEREWSAKLTQAHAELSAAMEGLGAARRATQELEARMAKMDTAKAPRGAEEAVAPSRPAAPQVEQPSGTGDNGAPTDAHAAHLADEPQGVSEDTRSGAPETRPDDAEAGPEDAAEQPQKASPREGGSSSEGSRRESAEQHKRTDQ